MNADSSKVAGEGRSSTSNPLLSPARSITVANWIAQRVRAELFEGRLKSGDFVGTELDLAQNFHVSRIAARDALKTLEAEGIVTLRPGPGGGARIANENLHRFSNALAVQLKLAAVTEKEIYVAQQAIELTATEFAARHATASDLKALDDLLSEARSLRSDVQAFTRSCWAFHAAVTHASRNRILIALRDAIESVIPDAYRGTPTSRQIDVILHHHQKILGFLKAKDSKGAGHQMRLHMRSLHRWLEDLAARRSPQASTPRQTGSQTSKR